MSTRAANPLNGNGLDDRAMIAPGLALQPVAPLATGAGMARPGAYYALLDTHADQVCERVMKVQREVSAMPPEQLREANGHLLGAALEAVSIAKIAAREFGTLVHTSRRDALTGTPDRDVMHDRIEQAAMLARRRGSHIAVFFLDLDGFKQINDTLGHAAGDEVLKLVARRLEYQVRDSDTVSRHGGDEFLVLLADVAQPADAVAVAASMLASLIAPAQVSGREIALSGSLGVAIFPEDGEDADTLIARADAAMYGAKRAGGGELTCCRDVVAPLCHADASQARIGKAQSTADQPASVRKLRELVQAHGGTVIAVSGAARSQGSSFVVTLPKR
jgi:diguanylate cyclase (GGDEF)-like protein